MVDLNLNKKSSQFISYCSKIITYLDILYISILYTLICYIEFIFVKNSSSLGSSVKWTRLDLFMDFLYAFICVNETGL